MSTLPFARCFCVKLQEPTLFTSPFVFKFRTLLFGVVWGLLYAQNGYGQSLPTKALIGLESEHKRVRIVSIQAISKSKDRRARRIIEGMLSDSSPTVRAVAAEALGDLKDEASTSALKKASADKSKIVRASALKALLTIQGGGKGTASQSTSNKSGTPSISTEVTLAEGSSPNVPQKLLTAYRKAVVDALRKNTRRRFDISKSRVERGYGLRLSIQSYRVYKEKGASIVEVKCRMNLVRLPGNTLRLSAKALAGVGVEGNITPKDEAQFAKEAVAQCGPELAKDFVDYAISRIPQ
jgi:hypothetical protein